MPIYGPDNTMKVELRYTWGTQLCMNTLYVRGTSVPSTETCQNVAEIIGNWWGTGINSFTSDTVLLREVYVVSVHEEAGPEYTYAQENNNVGTVAYDSLPNNCCLAISFRTGQSGRSYRGRNYTVGMCENHQADSLATFTYAAAIRGYYDALLATLEGEGYELVVVSKYHNKLPRTRAIGTKVVSVIVTDNVLDSQRRRLPSRGR